MFHHLSQFYSRFCKILIQNRAVERQKYKSTHRMCLITRPTLPSTWILWLSGLRFGKFHHHSWAVGSYSSGPPAGGTPQNNAAELRYPGRRRTLWMNCMFPYSPPECTARSKGSQRKRNPVSTRLACPRILAAAAGDRFQKVLSCGCGCCNRGCFCSRGCCCNRGAGADDVG